MSAFAIGPGAEHDADDAANIVGVTFSWRAPRSDPDRRTRAVPQRALARQSLSAMASLAQPITQPAQNPLAAPRRACSLTIQKWLAAGVLEDGKWSMTEEGTPQGATISPLLANVYLHYVFDLWVQQWRARSARGAVYVVRYADDIVLGFQHEVDARRFHAELPRRLKHFGLELHSDKTRLLRFGRFAEERRRERGQGKPETFNFLGFTHICGKSRSGQFLLLRYTMKDRLRAKLKEIRKALLRRRHLPIPVQGEWLGAVVRGYFAYHAVPLNSQRLQSFVSPRGTPS